MDVLTWQGRSLLARQLLAIGAPYLGATSFLVQARDNRENLITLIVSA
jgi:hypothetical protein